MQKSCFVYVQKHSHGETQLSLVSRKMRKKFNYSCVFFESARNMPVNMSGKDVQDILGGWILTKKIAIDDLYDLLSKRNPDMF